MSLLSILQEELNIYNTIINKNHYSLSLLLKEFSEDPLGYKRELLNPNIDLMYKYINFDNFKHSICYNNLLYEIETLKTFPVHGHTKIPALWITGIVARDFLFTLKQQQDPLLDSVIQELWYKCYSYEIMEKCVLPRVPERFHSITLLVDKNYEEEETKNKI